MTEQAELIYHECLIDDTSGGDWLKYWEARVVGSELFFREGSLKNQHTNKWKSKTYASPEAAVASAKKRRFNKIKKHYREGTFDERGSAIPVWPEFFEGFVDEIQCLLDGDLEPGVLRCKLEYVYNTVYARYPSRTEAKLDDYLREQLKTRFPIDRFSSSVSLFEYVSHPQNKWRKALAVVSTEGKKTYPFARFTRKFTLEFNGNSLFQEFEQFDEVVDDYFFESPIDLNSWRESGVVEHLEYLEISYRNLSDPWQVEDIALSASELKALLEAAPNLKHLCLGPETLHYNALNLFGEEGVCTLDSLTFKGDLELDFACKLGSSARQNIHTLVLSSNWRTLAEVTSLFTKKSDFFAGLKRVDIHNRREKSFPKALGEKFGALPSLSQVETIALTSFSFDFLAGWCLPDATTCPREFIVLGHQPSLKTIQYIASLEHWPFEKVVFEFPRFRRAGPETYTDHLALINDLGVSIELRDYCG